MSSVPELRVFLQIRGETLAFLKGLVEFNFPIKDLGAKLVRGWLHVRCCWNEWKYSLPLRYEQLCNKTRLMTFSAKKCTAICIGSSVANDSYMTC